MLEHLSIKNYVLIEHLDIDFHPGFSILTGETGAGKSIILGALGLLMGQRADAKSIMPGAAKCSVEAVFNAEGLSLEPLFDENDLDYEPAQCILRREVAATGKSRAFINDSPVSATVLRQIALHLLDIHSQHNNLLLENAAFQLGIVDTIAAHDDLLQSYKAVYARLTAARRQLRQSEEELEQRRKDEDYLTFQYEQLQELAPKAGEDEELEALQSELSHAEEIKGTLMGIDSLFTGEGDAEGAIDMLRHAGKQMQSLAKIYPAIEDYLERMESVIIEIKDISSDISRRAEDVEYNPERLLQVTERLDALYTLEQKHHVDSSDALLTLMEDLRRQLDSLSTSEENIEALRKQIEKDTKEATALATKLSAGRLKAGKEVEKAITASLAALDMPAAVFHVDLKKGETLLADGLDTVAFSFSANKSIPPRPLEEVASGGEMARVMLSLKALTSHTTDLPTIIFDEIDTGVSGKVADSMARMMQEMSQEKGRQVLAITHLPQIAAMGSSHYFVYKEERDGRTLSHIRELTPDERVTEIAHMLSGNTVTEAALENARQLLKAPTDHPTDPPQTPQQTPQPPKGGEI